jgi:NADH-quinone oxidoreductase subunit F
MKTIKVGLGTCGVSAGGEKVYTALKEEIAREKIPVNLHETGCMGNCYQEVLLEIIDEKGDSRMYGNVTPDKVKRILDEQVRNSKPIPEWIVKGRDAMAEDTFFAKQKRIVLRNCGIIDPNSIKEYIASGGYQAIRRVLKEYTPEQVIDIILKSGLRGRGGAGFLTGMKWRFCLQAAGDKKYIICNADEGDPGAFMDRSTLESDPHSVLEGMMICAYACGSDEAYIYVRAEYPMAVRRLQHSILKAAENGFLGKNIFGSKMNLNIKIKEGAGAFVCGEETALIASIEGKRGMPRFRPPFPAKKAFGRNRPTSTTWKPSPTFHGSSSMAPRLSHPWAPRTARELKSSPWPARSPAAGWSRSPWD